MVEVRFEAVSYRIGEEVVLSDIDLRVPPGSLTAIIGPSGAGKSTVLRLVAGLARPTAGLVTVAGSPVGRSSPPGVSMVFQGEALYEHMDVAGNLRFPLQVGGEDDETVRRVAEGAARRIGVRRLWRRRPRTLSGGERGLVATARAVSRTGLRVLLLDEPLAFADRHMRERFRVELRRLHETEGITTILATNDQEEAMAIADLLVVLIDGRVAQVGSPRSVLESPERTDVATFVGVLPMNLLPAAIDRVGGEAVAVIGHDRVRLGEWPVGVESGCRVVVGLHAHELFVAPPGTPFDQVLHVVVGRVEDLGASRNVLFGLGRSAAGTFVMNENRPAAVRPGDRLELSWAPGRARLFRADTGAAIPMEGGRPG